MSSPSTISHTLRTLVVDDEPLAREGIRILLARDRDIKIVGEAEDGPSAIAAIKRLRPDLVFLDVQMPEQSGLDVLRALPSDGLPIVVFVTAFDKYAIDAFEAHALDYLLKPVDAQRFAQTLERIKLRSRERELSDVTERLLALINCGTVPVRSQRERQLRIPVSLAGKIKLVDIASIDWVEAEDDYVRLHVGKSSHLLRKTLSALESELDSAQFARIHRSTIVNIARVKELHAEGQGDYAIVLLDGTRLRMSRTYRDRLTHLLP